MNIDQMSPDYGKIVRWDSLSDEQKQSGQWILLPTHNEDGEPAMAKRKNPLDELFQKPDRNASIMRDLNAAIREEKAAVWGRACSEEADREA